jgi:hypothetical protein
MKPVIAKPKLLAQRIDHHLSLAVRHVSKAIVEPTMTSISNQSDNWIPT